MYILFAALLALPTPEVARAELHPSAEACFQSLSAIRPRGIAVRDIDQMIRRACQPFLARIGCSDAQPDGCGRDRRVAYHLLVEALLERATDEPDFVWQSGGELPRPFDLFTAAAAGAITSPEMHARLIAAMLVQHLQPEAPIFGNPR